MNLVEKNILIGKFMNLDILTNEDCVKVSKEKFWPHELKYHEDWNLLMPVCKKIHKLYFDMRQEMYSGLQSCDIERTYEGVIEFLKFWNDANEPKYIWTNSPQEAIDFIKEQGCVIINLIKL